MSESFTGTPALLRLALRRDRVLLPVSVAGFAAMAGFSAAATVGLYPEQEQRLAAASAVNSTAALVALYGKIYDPNSEGALALFKLTAFGAAIIAVLMTVIVVRHTRSEEESGRLELLGSAAVGRRAALTAALLVAVLGSLGIGAATALALIGAGLEAPGSLAFGLGWAMSGIAFAAIAGLCAQVSASSRVARGLGLAAIAVAYLMRAVGDLAADAPGWQSWLSPIGWMQQIRAYAGDQWWVLLLPLVLVAVVVPAAFWLRERRDLGAGLVAERPGPAQGRIGGAFLLAWRLQRGALFAWVVAFAVFGLVLGSIADTVSGFLDSPQIMQYLEALGGKQTLTDAFLAAELGLIGVIAAGYGINAAYWLREEESDGRAESMLAAPVGRLRWGASHLAMAAGGVVVLMLTAGLCVGIGFSRAVPDSATSFGDIVVAALARVPAALVMTAVVIVLFGFAPRFTASAWLVYAAAVAVGELGAVWGAPQWLRDLSPFVHSPILPSSYASTAALVPLTLVALGLAMLGLLGWRRRDTPA